MKQPTYFIIDFDNTFTQVEALDELARISLANREDKEQVFEEIENLTNKAMEGKMSFSESLAKRIQLLDANVAHLEELVNFLKQKISRSFMRNASFFKEHADEVLIVSGGFKEFIIPVVGDFFIKEKNIYANTFVTDNDGNIIGYDENNPLSEEGGKVKLLKALQLKGELLGIGDGYSDYQLKESGMVSKFFAFTENVSRKSVTEKADYITPSFDEFLYLNNLQGTISYPKNRIICLIVGEVTKEYVDILKQDGLTVKHKKSFDSKYLKDARVIILGKHAHLTKDILKAAKKLRCIGITDYVNDFEELNFCSKHGIVVFAGNTQTPLTDRLLAYINEGVIFQSLNFPDLVQSKIPDTHRIVLLTKSEKEALNEVTEIFHQHPYNMYAVSLRTTKGSSIALVDLDVMRDKQLIKTLKKHPAVLHVRVLY